MRDGDHAAPLVDGEEFQQHFGTRSIFIPPQPPPEISVTTVPGGDIAP